MQCWENQTSCTNITDMDFGSSGITQPTTIHYKSRWVAFPSSKTKIRNPGSVRKTTGQDRMGIAPTGFPKHPKTFSPLQTWMLFLTSPSKAANTFLLVKIQTPHLFPNANINMKILCSSLLFPPPPPPPPNSVKCLLDHNINTSASIHHSSLGWWAVCMNEPGILGLTAYGKTTPRQEPLGKLQTQNAMLRLMSQKKDRRSEISLLLFLR